MARYGESGSPDGTSPLFGAARRSSVGGQQLEFGDEIQIYDGKRIVTSEGNES